MKFNEGQEKAIKTILGPVAVYAGPGSGKTRTLVERIKHMVDSGINSKEILAITFTNKAAAEMKERLMEYISEELNVNTFHGFCVSELIKENSELTAIDEKTGYEIYCKVAQKINASNKLKDFFELMKLKETIGFDVRAMPKTTPVEVEKQKLFSAYEKEVKKRKLLNFPDLLMMFYEKITSDTEYLNDMQEKYKYIMVDEYQDTNNLQYNIAKTLASKYRNLFIVGDDDQSIYSFRGADFKNIMNFEKDYPDATIIRLTQNYRSDSKIVEFNLKAIKNNEKRIEKELFSENNFIGSRVEFFKDGSRFNSARTLSFVLSAEESQEIAIICRTNFEIEQIKKWLSKTDKRENFEDFKLDLNLQKKRLKLAHFTKENFIEYAELLESESRNEVFDQRSLERIKNSDYALMTEVLENVTLPQKIKNNILDLKKKSREEFVQLNFSEFIKKIGNEISKNIPAFYKECWKRIIENNTFALSKIELEYMLAEKQDKVKILEELEMKFEEMKPKNRIRFFTAHGSKGLEFDTVMVYGAKLLKENDFVFESIKPKTEEELEEERRVFYVAASRAKKQLLIFEIVD